jgi:hypothetical protein
MRTTFFKLLFLASTMLITSCYNFEHYPIKITNNSEYNITWVVIVDTDAKKEVINKKDNELIAKNGGSKTFAVDNDVNYFIVCVEAEDTSEPMCTATRDGGNGMDDEVSVSWNGSNSSGWVPATSFPACPKVFEQCNSEVEDE